MEVSKLNDDGRKWWERLLTLMGRRICCMKSGTRFHQRMLQVLCLKRSSSIFCTSCWSWIRMSWPCLGWWRIGFDRDQPTRTSSRYETICKERAKGFLRALQLASYLNPGICLVPSTYLWSGSLYCCPTHSYVRFTAHRFFPLLFVYLWEFTLALVISSYSYKLYPTHFLSFKNNKFLPKICFSFTSNKIKNIKSNSLQSPPSLLSDP